MRYTVLSFIACSLFSCHQPLPTEEMAFQKFLLKQGDKNNAIFQFRDFKKTDGVKQSVFGQEIYIMDYHVQKIAKQDMHECQGMDVTYFITDSSLVADSIRQSSFKTGHLDRPRFIKAYQKGQLVQELDGKLTFTNKENGWK